MFKNILTLFGIGLIVLWLVGLSVTNATPYMTWLDGVGGLLSFILAGSPGLNRSRSSRAGATIVLSIGLFGLWLGGLLSGAFPWQVWWTFGAACAYFVLGVASGFSRPSAGTGYPEQEKPRRVA